MFVFGVIPYSSFKERIRIINKLNKEIKNPKIVYDNELIYYRYYDKSRIF